MATRDDIIIYSVMQYAHNQKLRRTYRIGAHHVQMLCAMYYLDKINPPKIGKRTRLQEINKLFNQDKVDRLLNDLKDRDLVVWEKTDNPRVYELHLSKEGTRVVKELFSEESIGELLDKY